MIYLREFWTPEKATNEDHLANIHIIHFKLNYLRALWKRPIYITSGYRTLDHHKKIYLEKGVSESKIPMGSKHLIGAAVDLSDGGGLIDTWLFNDQMDMQDDSILSKLDLFMEHPDDTPGWCHLQIYPPASGERIFRP